jgi:hypothetical protein
MKSQNARSHFLLYLFDSDCLGRSILRSTPDAEMLLSVACRGASTRVGGGLRRRRVPLLWVALRLRGVTLGLITLGCDTLLGRVATGLMALGCVVLG